MEKVGEERDVYVDQLHEVFDSCDHQGAGRLDRNELLTLCSKLQLEEQAESLVEQLLGNDQNARVGFDQFKEGFVAVLSQVVEGLESSEDELDVSADELGHTLAWPGEEDGVPGGDGEEDRAPGDHHEFQDDKEAELSINLEGLEMGDVSPTIEITAPSSKPPSPHKTASRHGSPSKTTAKTGNGHGTNSENGEVAKSETFEAEGQMNQSIAEMENALDPVSEEEHLKEIWRELGVGRNGHLTLPELATVCTHIGMDEMDTEELQHLFDKLDVDHDGCVSFQEFLQGLFQHGGPATPSTPVQHTRSLSTPRQKLRFSVSMDDRTTTPSFISTGSGIFSYLDADTTGYAKADVIIEQWESAGIPQGADILEYLEFDLNTKINLGELSYALEQELHLVEEDNACFQAVIASYQQEMKHIKMTNEHAIAERDKLQADLADSHVRIAALVKEGDERHAALDRNKEREISELERHYQEQLKSLQGELETERETMLHQSGKQRQTMEKQIETLKEEETKLKDKLNQTQKELEKLEKEILEMAEQCSQLEKHNLRQQRELDTAADLHKKLEEIESSREQVQDEQQRFTQQKLQQLETDNKELKDKNDELTMEVEEVKQQLTISRKRSKTPKGKMDATTPPQRMGSVLSDYTKPTVIRRSVDGETNSEHSEEEDLSLSSSTGRMRRKLPMTPAELSSSYDDGMTLYSEKLQLEVEELKKAKENLQEKHQQEEEDLKLRHHESVQQLQLEKETLELQLREELREVRAGMEVERREIEQAYKMEVTDIEDQHVKEKEEMLNRTQKEIEEAISALKAQYDADTSEKLATQQEELKQAWQEERREILIKGQSEKNYLEQKFAEEKSDIVSRIKREASEEVQVKLQRQKTEYDEKLDRITSKDRSDTTQLNKQIAELEIKLKLQKEELELEFEQQKVDLREAYDKDKAKLQEKHRLDILHYEQQIAQLTEERDREREERDREREEHDREREEHDREREERDREREEHDREREEHDREREERDREREKHDKEREEYDREKVKLSEEHDMEKAEMTEEHDREKAEMTEEHDREKAEMTEEHDREKAELIKEHNREKSVLQEDHELNIQGFEDIFSQGAEALQGKLKSDFYTLVEQHAAEAVTEEQTKLVRAFQRDRDDMERNFNQKHSEISEKCEMEKAELVSEHTAQLAEFERLMNEERQLHGKEKTSLKQNMLKQYRDQIMDLELKLEEEQEKGEKGQEERRKEQEERRKEQEERRKEQEERRKEQEQHEQSLIHQRETLGLEQEALREQMELAVVQDIQAQLEEEFLDQIERIKAAFEDERSQLDTRATMLQEALEDAQQRHLQDDNFRQQMETQYKTQINELNTNITNLTNDKSKYQDMYDKTNKNLCEVEDRLQCLLVEKDSTVQAVEVQMLNTIPKHLDTDRDKEILEAIASQRILLESKTSELKDHIQTMHTDSTSLSALQSTKASLTSEKLHLERRLDTMQAQISELREKTSDYDSLQAQLTNWEQERDLLRSQIQTAENQVAEVRTSLSVAQGDHAREVTSIRDQLANTVELSKYNALSLKLTEAEKKSRDLETALEERAAETSKMLIGSQEDHQRALRKLEEEKEELKRQLDRTKALLNQNVTKLKELMERAAKSDLLVKDLYVENSELMQSLCETEKRQKDAYHRVYNLEDKCQLLQKLVNKITIAAMA